MVDAFKREILPKIKTVKGTQLKIDLANSDGDTVVGYADLLCEWETGEDVVIDFKTSSITYEEDSVKISPQLALYAHSLNVKKAGFIVFRKLIQKNRIKVCSKCSFDGSGARHKTCSNVIGTTRCNGEWKETINPKVTIQIILDNVPERTQDIVIENLDMVNRAIKEKIFHRNFNSCKGPFGLCPYINLCFKGEVGTLEKYDSTTGSKKS